MLHLLVHSGAGIESYLVKQAFPQDATIILIFFHKTGVSFQYSLLNKKVYKFIKSEILQRYFSRATVKRSILQLYRTSIFLA